MKRRMQRGERKGKGKRKRILLMLVRQTYEIEHDKGYVYAYKLNYSSVKHNKSFLKALNNRTK